MGRKEEGAAEYVPEVPSAKLGQEEKGMNCLRCRAPMYRVTDGAQPPKATCSSCSQFVDCAKCSKCGDLKCLKCYNKAAAGTPKTQSKAPLVPDDQEF